MIGCPHRALIISIWVYQGLGRSLVNLVGRTVVCLLTLSWKARKGKIKNKFFITQQGVENEVSTVAAMQLQKQGKDMYIPGNELL